MTTTAQLFTEAAAAAARYRAELDRLPVCAADPSTSVAAFALPLPEHPLPEDRVLAELAQAATPGLMATAGPRYFGFVIGGSLPVAAAADMLAVGWDQCAYNAVLSPAAAAAEDAAGTWLKELLGLPTTASTGFVTGAQAANTVGLAAARHRVLAQVGWDVEERGLLGAPAVRIVASSERHATVDRALRLLGFGTAAVEAVGIDGNGAIDVDDLRRVLDAGPSGPTVVCLQAGNVNTGAVDDFPNAIAVARRRDAWVHVDGAFGLWAAANPATAHLVRGVDQADSWGCDGHKWLNVPYDAGFAFCADPDLHAASVSYSAAYLVGSGTKARYVAGDLVPESSRRARGFAVWAALRGLGRSGVAELVERCCALARRMADALVSGGMSVANEVVLNQVLVDAGDAARTDALIDAVQREGTCWLGGTTWRGRRLIRVSVSNWATTEDDIDRSAAAILRLARELA